MINMPELFHKLKCKEHHKTHNDYLSLDPISFEVICTICQKENKQPKANLIIDDDNNQSSFYQPCYKHHDAEGIFYCNECNRFTCTTCFATIHKRHHCSTIALITDDIKDTVNKLYEVFKSLQKELLTSGSQAEMINQITYTPKHNFKVKLEGIEKNIHAELEEYKTRLISQVEDSFSKLDLSNETIITQMNKANEIHTQLKKLLNAIQQENLSNSMICLIKENEGKDIVTKALDILSQLKPLNKGESTEEKLLNHYKTQEARVSLYEKSIIHAMVSKIPNYTLKIRRFHHYTQAYSKYFKIDTLCLITSHSIYLKGIGICGIFQPETQTQIASTSYDINVSLYEIKDVNSFNPKQYPPILRNDITIPVISNPIDPTYQLYFTNPVIVSSKTLYYIILTNTSNASFINTWTGCFDEDIEDQHSIYCNNSSGKFNFLNTYGIDSDINEFSNGIISDLYFNQIE